MSESFGSRGKGTILKFRETHTPFLPGPIITKSAEASADPGPLVLAVAASHAHPPVEPGASRRTARAHPAPARGRGEPAPDRAITAASGAQTRPPGTPTRAVKDSWRLWRVWVVDGLERSLPAPAPERCWASPVHICVPKCKRGQDHVNARSFPHLKLQPDPARKEGSAFRRVS